MIGKALQDDSCEALKAAVESGDLARGFEIAHALKGVTGNLALTPIYAPVSEITELLRARTDTDCSALIDAIRRGRDRLEELCAR